jgi:hypothetical protein
VNAAEVRKRLAGHEVLKHLPVNTREDYALLITRMDEKANEMIRESASRIFFATAISQNGRFDSMVVVPNSRPLSGD